MYRFASPFHQSLAILGGSFALGLVCNGLFIAQAPGLNVPLFIGLCAAALLALCHASSREIPRQARLLLVSLAFFAAMVAVRASGFLTALNIVACLVLSLLVAYTAAGNDVRHLSLGQWVRLPFVATRFLHPIRTTIGTVVSFKGLRSDRRTIDHVVVGVLLALPVLVVFSLLFASADAIFAQLLNRLTALDVSGEFIGRSVIVGVVSLVLTGAYAYIIHATTGPDTVTDRNGTRKLGSIETGIVLGSVAALFLLFITLQLTYLFGGGIALAEQGLTYAEYARRGFFELIIVALLSFALIWTARRTTALRADGRLVLFQRLSSLLIAEVLVIMASAFYRLGLYETAFGFTTLRLYSHAFIIFLAVLLVLLLIHIIRDRQDHVFVRRAALTVALSLALTNLANPDGLVASLNINRYEQSGKIDVEYLAGLSADATPTLVRFARRDGEEPANLADLLRYDREYRDTDAWPAFNLARYQADRALQQVP